MADIRVYHTGATPDGTTWATAYTTVTNGLSGRVASDTVWVAPSHSVSAGVGITWVLPATLGLRVLGVGSNSADPATSLASPPTAVEAVGASSQSFAVRGMGYIEGVGITGSSNNSAAALISLGDNNSPHALFFRRCPITIASIHASAALQLGASASSSNDDCQVNMDQCSVKFGGTSQSIQLRHGRIRMRDLSLDAAGSIPTTLFVGVNGCSGVALVEDSDLSGRAFTNLANVAWTSSYELDVCRTKVPSGMALTTGTHSGPGGVHIRLHRVSDGDTEWGYGESYNAGSLVEDDGITRTGGGPVSIALDTNANVKFPYHPLVLKGSIWNATVGSSVTLTVQMVTDRATALTSGDVALRVHYQGNSGSTQGEIATSEPADVFASTSTLTSSSETWGGTSGFTNAQKREIAVSFTPQEAGYIEWELCVFTDLTNPLYVDAEAVLS